MSSLLALLSPAKLIDDQSHYPNLDCSEALFSDAASQLMSLLKQQSPAQLAKLMEMSASLGKETHERVARWQLPFTHQNAHPALLMFKGEVYRGLQANELSGKQLKFAQKHIAILSGLYGILRPLDLVMPYRLMMGTRFSVNAESHNLYAFWSEKITTYLDGYLSKKATLINLASDEYFKVIDSTRLNRRIIVCEFKQNKNNRFTTVNTYAKHARGSMARFIVENEVSKADDIRAFDTDGYAFNASLSDSTRFVFTR